MIDLNNLTAIEHALYGEPSLGRGNHRRRAAQRARTMAQMYLEGDVSLDDIGQVYGITRERVRQILTMLGISSKTVADTREQMKQEARQKSYRYSLERLLERCRNATVCKVCGGWNLRGTKHITCSQECADIWVIARYQLDPDTHERQRRASARWMLKQSDLKKREGASRILNNPPNRRYYYEGSKSHQAVLEAERLRRERAQ